MELDHKEVKSLYRLADLPERHLMITLAPRERDTRDLVVEGVGTGWEPLFRALRESA